MIYEAGECGRLRPILISQSLKDAIEKTESFKNDSTGLLTVLVPYSQRLKKYENVLRQAVTFWSLSNVLHEMRDDPETMNKFRPYNNRSSNTEEDKTFSYLVQAESFTSASIVFRTWVSLIYLRSDAMLRELRKIGNETKSAHLNAFVKLLACDDARHIRNALSHGTFSAFAMEFEYIDEKHFGRISYDQLDRLNSGVYALLLSVWAAALAPQSNT